MLSVKQLYWILEEKISKYLQNLPDTLFSSFNHDLILNKNIFEILQR